MHPRHIACLHEKEAHRKTCREVTASRRETSSQEKKKAPGQVITSARLCCEEAQGCDLRGTETVEWNTDLIETMKHENVIRQATQGVYSGEEQHESQEADVHEDLTERDEENTNDGKLVPAQTIEQVCKYSKTHVNAK